MAESELTLTEVELIDVFLRYRREMKPRRRAVFLLAVIAGWSHERIVEHSRGAVPTIGASRVELRRARADLHRLALSHGDATSIYVRREFQGRSVFVEGTDDDDAR